MKGNLVISLKVHSLCFCALLFIVQLQANCVYGQQKSEYNDLRNTLNFMFEHLNKKSVPTGLLRDYAIEEEDLDLYTGFSPLTDKNKVTIVRYAGLLSSIKSAALISDPIKGFESTLKHWDKTKNTNVIRLSIMSFDYAQIKSDALTSGLIEYKNGQVKNVTSANPYQIRKVFAGCCIDYTTTNHEVSIILPQDYLLTNTEYANFAIDYGTGFIPLSPNKPLKATLKDGENSIIIKVQLDNGETLTSHTAIVVQPDEKANTRLGFIDFLHQPDATKTITGKAYNGVQTSAKISIKYGVGHNSIIKPFIFVEGFDPRCLSPETDGVWNFVYLYKDYYKKIEDLRSRGYDIIYVDWNKSEEYIQANANTLIEVLSFVNAQKAAINSTEPNVVMGHSMGGLIARYALKKMEDKNIKHEVNTYISYDSPHLGAHIPLGVLYGFHAIRKFVKDYNILTALIELLGDIDIDKYIQYGESLAYSTAAQQMLVYYVDPAGWFNNSEHIAWQKEINALGFPKGDSGATFNMLAISNGNYSSIFTPTNTYLSTKFNGETDILHLIPWLSSVAIGLCLNDIVAALINILPGRTSIEGVFELFPAKAANQQITHINMKYKKKFLWIVPITKTVFTYDRYFPGGYLFDTYPSSTYAIPNAAQLEKNLSVDVDIPVIVEFNTDVNIWPDIPFIPVSSALSFGNGLTNNSSNFNNAPLTDDTPFGENYLLQPSANHSRLTDRAWSWIDSRLGVSIIGTNVGESGSQYSLSNAKGYVTWSTSNSNVASINQQGILSVKSKGIISIVATCNGIKYSKQILVGLPRFVLSASHEPGGYKVHASCIDSQYADHLSDLNNAISYNWGVKFPNKNVTWAETKGQDILIPLEGGSREVTVFLKVADKLGNSVTTQSIKVSSQDIYVASNQKLYIAANGNMYDDIFDRYSYNLSRIYIEYLPGISDEYKKLKWMITSANVISPFSTVRNIDVSKSGPQIKDVLPQTEFDFIKNGSEDNQSYTYMLVLYNAEELMVQYFPIVFIYKENI